MEHLVGIVAFVIPVVAIIGGISMGMVRTVTQARLEELARRERIAAIERGVDPAKLSPLPASELSGYGLGYSRLRRAHGLLIGGLITVAAGLGVSAFVYSMEPEKTSWLVGLIPLFVGIALLISAKIIWPPQGASGGGAV
jgi:uncharacterized protein DUF6249